MKDVLNNSSFRVQVLAILQNKSMRQALYDGCLPHAGSSCVTRTERVCYLLFSFTSLVPLYSPVSVCRNLVMQSISSLDSVTPT